MSLFEKPTQDPGEADEHWFLRFIAAHVEHIGDRQEEFMAILDTLAANIAQAQVDASAAADRVATDLAVLTASVNDLTAQVAALTADVVDPAQVAALESAVAGISATVNAIDPAAAPAPAPEPLP